MPRQAAWGLGDAATQKNQRNSRSNKTTHLANLDDVVVVLVIKSIVMLGFDLLSPLVGVIYLIKRIGKPRNNRQRDNRD
jgi:hypothetical protein